MKNIELYSVLIKKLEKTIELIDSLNDEINKDESSV